MTLNGKCGAGCNTGRWQAGSVLSCVVSAVCSTHTFLAPSRHYLGRSQACPSLGLNLFLGLLAFLANVVLMLYTSWTAYTNEDGVAAAAAGQLQAGGVAGGAAGRWRKEEEEEEEEVGVSEKLKVIIVHVQVGACRAE